MQDISIARLLAAFAFGFHIKHICSLITWAETSVTQKWIKSAFKDILCREIEIYLLVGASAHSRGGANSVEYVARRRNIVIVEQYFPSKKKLARNQQMNYIQ